MTIDSQKMEQLVGRLFGEISAGYSGALVLIGDMLGYYKELAKGPLTSSELAEKTNTSERYAREWLSAQAAADYLQYDPAGKKFSLSPEQDMIFNNEDSPAYLMGGFYAVSAAFSAVPKLIDAFKSGKGVPWGEQHEHIFCATAKFFRPTYLSQLIQSWIPALEGGMVDKLKKGGKVADVGCGFGTSTIILAKEFPNSHFYGYDAHPPSIEKARYAAQQAGLKNVTFEVASAKDYSEKNFDLVAMFDCLHDMGDPVGATAHARESLKGDGSVIIVEPFAHDHLEENLNPIGRIYYSASTMFCTPSSLSQEVGLGLGAQAGEARMRDVVTQGGFTRFRRAAESPFNIVYEARI
ncbi:class I SAM-dependent methyltransferase [Leptospira gomenensis]|uniref:Class I SAM-dependent methyltransferase n=1 Tax=Leptospira gomenensis TaxID=2484974 RepID=A0A5F1Y736_9LEPT|nr:class I SAM-dependent methyltransferase [Leptospira gomenensis]TGK29419.1 class I SAM-dependent methyltransferase [Leptospira gomenensis]TGK33678.1 class I SAM-dependent methyltransferase [Leptospira gomenensis]TGK44919.1 class I SAM-dependent methyltransferase [Leptospira gomenensis]TGK64540.1 class I SAM-dependent methyltransferase [Leptospira gomenensis]